MIFWCSKVILEKHSRLFFFLNYASANAGSNFLGWNNPKLLPNKIWMLAKSVSSSCEKSCCLSWNFKEFTFNSASQSLRWTCFPWAMVFRRCFGILTNQCKSVWAILFENVRGYGNVHSNFHFSFVPLIPLKENDVFSDKSSINFGHANDSSLRNFPIKSV